MNDYYDEETPTKRPEDGELKPGEGMPLRGGDLEVAPATKPENDAEDELRRRAPLHYRPADFDDAPTIPCDEGGGSVLARRYHILKQLGQGGMGSVYLAEDLELDKKLFAIKMLPSVLVANEAAYRQLKGEALMAMKLVHTNIVQIRAFEENGGNPFLVMDYIEGKTLSNCLAERGKLSAEETAALLKPVAAAIDYAHSQKVVHRDIKPGNVLIRKDGVPFVLDFGIAREIHETMTRVTGRSSGGTLLYMSPEQLHGRAPKPAQDVYSFAAMAYECMKGEPPFVRGQVEYQIDNDPPEPLPEGTPIAAGVMAGLAKKPEDRPASCMAVIEGNGFSRAGHVEGVLGTGNGGQPAAQQPSTGEIYVKPVKPKTGLLLAGAAALAVAVLGGWYGWRKYDEDQRRRAEEARRDYDEKVAKLESEKRLSDSAKAAAAEKARLAAEKRRIESEKAAAEAERAKLAAEKEKADARIKQLAAEAERVRLAVEKKRIESEKAAAEAREKQLSEEKRKAAEAKRPKQGETMTMTLPGGATMEMIYVAPGSFTMGSPESEDGREDDERQHRVTLTKGFWLGKYEVTQAQWESVMGSDPTYFKGDDRPVENVSWNDCQEFIREVNAEAERQFGSEVRLPTEAEWEYACRAGSIGAFAGTGDLDSMGRYSGNSGDKTHPVGQKSPNAWGFYDMHGNVWEWCNDWYGSYPGGSVTDPAGAASGVGRVLRGGGWSSSARYCRSASRYWDYPGYRSGRGGFRLACSAGPRGQWAEQ